MNNEVKWGTKAPIKYSDKKYGNVEIIAYGNFRYEVINPNLINNGDVNEYYIFEMRQHVENEIAVVLYSKNGNNVSELKGLIDKNEILNKVNVSLINLGFKLIDINIIAINLTEESQKKVNELEYQQIENRVQNDNIVNNVNQNDLQKATNVKSTNKTLSTMITIIIIIIALIYALLK